MSLQVKGSCRQDGCNATKNGKCLEGLSLEGCPHFDFSSDEESQEILEEGSIEKTIVKDENSSELVQVYSGEPLNTEESSRIMCSSLTRVIVIGGSSGSGKTALLASINDLFQRGGFAEYLFAGSKTLPALERLSFDSRVVSGNIQATTLRTEFSNEPSLLHFCVASKNTSLQKQHILITDLSGEFFRMLSDSSALVEESHFLKRADHFVLLFDCEKLLDNQKKQEEKNSGISLLRSCIDEGVLGKHSFIDVVFAKWDLVENNAEKEQIISFIEKQIKSNIEKRFEKKVGELHFFNVVAQPQNLVNLPIGYGMDQLFSSWIEKSLLFQNQPNIVFEKSSGREFSRFGQRYFNL
jgi:hypothetical protein